MILGLLKKPEMLLHASEIFCVVLLTNVGLVFDKSLQATLSEGDCEIPWFSKTDKTKTKFPMPVDFTLG